MINLPKPIVTYVEANARLDAEGMLKAFAPDAVMYDEGRTHSGHAEILALIQKNIIALQAIFSPDTLREEEGYVIVEGPTTGNFRGSPLRFTFRFTLENDLITALEVTL
jgi:SnoaL-like domain